MPTLIYSDKHGPKHQMQYVSLQLQLNQVQAEQLLHLLTHIALHPQAHAQPQAPAHAQFLVNFSE